MKKFFKLFGIIALVAVIGLSMFACGGNGTGDGDDEEGEDGSGGGGGITPTITIKNNTGYEVYLYIKPSTEVKEWGYNQLDYSWSTLSDGGSYNCTLSKTISECSKYDIRLYGGTYNFIKFGVTVSNRSSFTFTTSDLYNMNSLPKITIQNRSGKNFDSVKIKPSSAPDSDYGDFGYLSNNSDNDNINIIIPSTNYTEFDIQAKSSNPTNTYTKTNVTITNGTTILITSADRVNSSIEPPVIVIKNNTGYEVQVFIRSMGSTDWGYNQLSYSWSTLGDGGLTAISVTSGYIDIKLKSYYYSYNFIQKNVLVEEGKVYTFTSSDSSSDD